MIEVPLWVPFFNSLNNLIAGVISLILDCFRLYLFLIVLGAIIDGIGLALNIVSHSIELAGSGFDFEKYNKIFAEKKYKTFTGAKEVIEKNYKKNIPARLLALEKQATFGDNKVKIPKFSWFCDNTEYYTWIEWKRLRGMTKREAYETYIEMTKTLVPDAYMPSK